MCLSSKSETTVVRVSKGPSQTAPPFVAATCEVPWPETKRDISKTEAPFLLEIPCLYMTHRPMKLYAIITNGSWDMIRKRLSDQGDEPLVWKIGGDFTIHTLKHKLNLFNGRQRKVTIHSSYSMVHTQRFSLHTVYPSNITLQTSYFSLQSLNIILHTSLFILHSSGSTLHASYLTVSNL